MSDILHKRLSDLIIKCAIEVQTELGAGFLEKVYENALVIAMQDEGLIVDQQLHMEVYFHGHLVGEFIADLVIENKILLELKAIERLATSHYAQVINYLNASKLEVGYLINFGKKPLEFKRLTVPNEQKHVTIK